MSDIIARLDNDIDEKIMDLKANLDFLMDSLILLKKYVEENGVSCQSPKFYNIWMGKYPDGTGHGSMPQILENISTNHSVACHLNSMLIQAKSLQEKVKV